jgi:transcription-repair coupling factor (superfamily II helicase)
VPFPVTNGELPGDADLIDWVSRLITAIFPIPEAPATDAAGSASTATG